MANAKVKISIEDFGTEKRVLHEIDKSKSIEENVKDICELFELPTSESKYGLMITSRNDGHLLFLHVSEENFHDIKDGYFLKLVLSVKYQVNEIFSSIRNNHIAQEKVDDLLKESVDPAFIKELAKSGKHEILINHFIKNDLVDKELTACLIAITHLFRNKDIVEVTQDFVKKILYVVKNEPNNQQLIYSLSIVQKILLYKDTNFNQWKDQIITELPLSELTPYIWSEDVKEVQYGALLLINTIIKCCKGDKRQQLIKEINMKKNREDIYKHIIQPGGFDKVMAHELYVYQTYLFSMFAESANSFISLNDCNLLKPEEFEIDEDEIARISAFLDFDEDHVDLSQNRTPPVENLLHNDERTRISFASMSSKTSSDGSRSSQRILSLISNNDYDCTKICHLTHEALRHYRKYHEKNFNQSQIEEKTYKPGIFVTSERVIRMLVKLLHVGEEPDRCSTFYQPPVFNCSTRTPFLLELFSRSMWLLSRTRREMKASTIDDFPKVMFILERQIKLVLEEKPMDFKSLTEKMLEKSHHVVMEHWQKEKDEEMDRILRENPNVLEIQPKFVANNGNVVFQHRMKFMTRGEIFPKIMDKKISGYFRAKLSENLCQFTIVDWNHMKEEPMGDMKTHNISDITHVVEGRACPHVVNNLVKNEKICFSIIIDNAKYINFKARDSKSASYWVDGFNLLLGKRNRSEFYNRELEQLVKMDLTLQLIELQNVPLPKKPPPIPPPPKPIDFAQFKPNLPPKPRNT